MSGNFLVRKLETLEEFHCCVELQRQIWGEADLEVEPATLFVVAAHTGGQVLGAFEDGRLIGYTLAVVGLRNGTAYLHSHMTGVQNEYRDRGVGRMLKLFQRQEALSRGIRLVQWTFDPLELRNAHFNLNRLGAICRQYLPNLYGTTTIDSGGNVPCPDPDGCGTVFKMTPNLDGSWAFSVLHLFTGKPARKPDAGLVLDKAGNLYGTAANCGSTVCDGVVFKITPSLASWTLGARVPNNPSTTHTVSAWWWTTRFLVGNKKHLCASSK